MKSSVSIKYNIQKIIYDCSKKDVNETIKYIYNFIIINSDTLKIDEIKQLDTFLKKRCNNYSLLHMAADNDNSNAVLYLLNKRFDPNQEESLQGDTPLIVAVGRGYAGVVKAFLEQKKLYVDISKINNTFRNPLHLAAFAGFDEIARLLLDEYHCRQDPKSTWRSSDIRDSFDAYGATPLFLAATGGQIKGIMQENTVVGTGHLEIVNMLLASNPELVNQKNWQTGETPLFAAVRSGRQDIVAALLWYGADIFIRNKDDQTALSFAT